MFGQRWEVFVMIHFKVCPRCHGDVYLREDIFGKYLSCLQCGYLKDLVEPGSPTADHGREAVGAGDHAGRLNP